MATLVASDIYPAVRKFLLENGLAKTLKAFDKESAFDETAVVPPGHLSKKGKKLLAKLELTAACQFWISDSAPSSGGEIASVLPAVEEEPTTTTTKGKKRKASEVAQVEETAMEEEQPKKKKLKEETPEDTAPLPEAAEENETAVEALKKQKKDKKDKKEKKEAKSGVPFKRVDDDKWRSTITDGRLMDNTHKAKAKFGGSAGDSWGDAAAVDMLKVKGKGFRKEMAKKKRASWKGAGELDQGVNSIKFDDSDDDE